MKQVLLRKGMVTVEEVPSPAKNPHHVLVEVTHSLISTGTEMSTVQLSQSSLFTKAKEKPQELKKVFDSIKVRGLMKTWALVQGKLDESRPLGYSCTGQVIAVGEKVTHLQIGDKVACAGAALANHAEVVSVPSNLVVKVPQGVSDKSAAFVTIGAIAMQGVRRADVRLGETVCVLGLGLIGQLTVQLLKSAGCKVVGLDLDPSRVEMATSFGLEQGSSSFSDLAKKVSFFTGDKGVDACIITASSASNEPAQQAFHLTRKKGRVVVVGAVGMDLPRSPFYEKEQDFVISCSYGPGRYDSSYEEEGHDYPFAYVRWTENRNMSSFLELIREGKVRVESLIEKEVSVQEAEKAYEALNQKNGSKPLAVVLTYSNQSQGPVKITGIKKFSGSIPSGKIKVALVGVGNFAKTTHIPNLEHLGDKIFISGVCTANSATALTMGRQLKAPLIATDFKEILSSNEVDAVIISTRDNQHASMALEALKAGKHVYLEKPMALTEQEVNQLNEFVDASSASPIFMVGFNRRFAPMTKNILNQIQNRTSPLIVSYRMNVGPLPLNHWVKTEEGGGRLRGEACHMVDFFRSLVGSPLKNCSVEPIHATDSQHLRPDENFSARFSYEDGSLCTLLYTALGAGPLSKEWVEIHWDGKSIQLDDYKNLMFYGLPEKNITVAQNKGHLDALNTFVEAIKNKNSFPIPWADLVETTMATIQLDQDVWGRLKN